MIICYGLALAEGRSSADNKQIHMLYQKTEFINGKTALKMQEDNAEGEDEPLEFTIWGSKKRQEVTYQEYFRTEQVDVIYFCGDSGMLFDTGIVLMREDTKGCLLSGDIAYKLFGTRNIKDVPVILNDQDYIVRGILSEERQTIAVQADKETEAVMDTVALAVPAGKTAAAVINNYETRYGAADRKVDFSALQIWAELLIAVLPLLMFLFLLVPAVKRAAMLRYEPVKCAVWMIGVTLFSVVFWKVSGVSVRLPFSVTPSTWSDFSYWGKILKEQAEWMGNLITMEKREPERLYIEQFLEVLKFMIAGLWIMVTFIRRLRIKSLPELYIYCAVNMSSVFFAVILVGTSGKEIASYPGIWIMPMIYLLGLLILKKGYPHDSF